MGTGRDGRKTLTSAIDIDLRTYATDPWRASVNQSLIRSYRLAGNTDKAQQHLAQALEIGVTLVQKYPDSAKAAYSYARTLQLSGRRADALEQFTRAHDFDRTSSKYRKAYYSARAASAP